MQRRPSTSPRRGMNLYLYVLVYGLATLVLHQWPLMSYLMGVITPLSRQGLAILTTLEVLQLVLIASLLLILGFVSIWLMKFVAAVLLVVNALAQYYMTSYGVVIDPTMIGNILNTDQAEAGGLIQPMMVLSVVLWGVIPALFALLVRVGRPHRLAVFVSVALVLALGAGTVYAASSTWLWFDDYGNRVGPRVLPWAYIGNGLRYGAEYQRRNRVPIALPDAVLPPPDPDGSREVVVLVIGEAARADHLAAFGYARPTTPFTQDLGVVAFPGGRSCATYTIGSVACILSYLGNEAEVSNPYEPLPSYLHRSGIDTVVRVNNSGLPPLRAEEIVQSGDLAVPCDGTECPDRVLDDVLLNGLADRINESDNRRVFVLLHFSGSHGPEYFRKYPPEFEVFTPVCRTTLVADCDSASLINAYDNSIRFTDYVLSELIGLLDALPNTQAMMLYVSDHGQSLGENGVYLHGLPNSIAPDAQRRVPLMAWMDGDYAAARGLDPQALVRPVDDPQDMIFHTVLGAFGLQSPIYRPEHDLFRAAQGPVTP